MISLNYQMVQDYIVYIIKNHGTLLINPAIHIYISIGLIID